MGRDLERFDVEMYLKVRGIPFSTSGKNVSRGWVGVKCIWCDDRSDHLGINLKTKRMKCWRCKRKGTATELVSSIDGVSLGRAESIMEDFALPLTTSIPKQQTLSSTTPRQNILRLPSGSSTTPLPPHESYLRGRGFDPSHLTEKYHLHYTPGVGDYRWRIIIPIFLAGRLVGYTGRDVTGKQKERYKACAVEKAVEHPSLWLYNADSIRGRDWVIIVEGPTDVWRLGDGVVCMFGTERTEGKVRKLLDMGVRRAFVVFDPEDTATRLSRELSTILSASIPHCETIVLERGDPAEMTPQEAERFKAELLR